MKVINLINEGNSTPANLESKFSNAVIKGFSQKTKKLSSEYFYDDIGSVLFQKITEQKEYYLTRTELAVLKEYGTQISNYFIEKEVDLVELGVGDGHKTKVLIEAFLKVGIKVNFYPIDISKEAMNLLHETMPKDSDLTITAVVAKYFSGLDYIKQHSRNQKLVLFLGSNIGNTDERKGEGFLHELHKHLNEGDILLTGFDLDKDIEILTNAYNDKAGYTSKFNLNLLTRMNNEFNANFDLKQFIHLGRYNRDIGAMESFLISKIDQTISFPKLDRSFEFKEFEEVHLEYSFKYTKEEITTLANVTGFIKLVDFTDVNNYFINSLWRK
jgi:dimethylhistidine N-methyltransferase